MWLTQNTISNNMTLDEALVRLAASEDVDGLALFGSRGTEWNNPISDYDLLILVSRLPIGIFQMLTHIDGRMADIVFVRTEMVDQMFSEKKRFPANSFEGM